MTFVISGCLTHSHETTDTEYDRLTTRVRNNIVQLLSIGVPLIAIKDKYLRPEYFGGATGKVQHFQFFLGFFRRFRRLTRQNSELDEYFG